MINVTAKRVDMEFAEFEVNLPIENALEEYMKVMNDKMKAEVIMPYEVQIKVWAKISAAARDTIWKMLFNQEESSQNDQLEKAAEFLVIYKEDACFYKTDEYNEWIVLVRDELLKRRMVDFWKNEIVQKELGPCWARDSDLYDDMDDPEPANFYNYEGCEAIWLKKKKGSLSNPGTSANVMSALYNTSLPETGISLKKISLETPLEDYKYNMDVQSEYVEDEEAYIRIFAEARDVIWQLLFGELTLSDENYEKAAELLEEYKRDACFYSPWEYNDWMPKLKAEILKREYTDFWENVIVAGELGLCWAGDSDYFDNKDDPIPEQFYNLEENSMLQEIE